MLPQPSPFSFPNFSATILHSFSSMSFSSQFLINQAAFPSALSYSSSAQAYNSSPKIFNSSFLLIPAFLLSLVLPYPSPFFPAQLCLSTEPTIFQLFLIPTQSGSSLSILTIQALSSSSLPFSSFPNLYSSYPLLPIQSLCASSSIKSIFLPCLLPLS
jgi:hypothetical protein